MSEEEQLSIGLISKEGGTTSCNVPYTELVSLYKRGLIYFKVPVHEDDYVVSKFYSETSSSIKRIHHEQGTTRI
jgi:hypothetical protein